MTDTTTETPETPAPETPVGDLVAALKEEGHAAARREHKRSGGPGASEAKEPDEAGTSEVQLADELPMHPDDDLSKEEEGEVSDRFVSIVESLLFAAKGPLTVRDIRKVLKEPTKRQIRLALRKIIEQYEERGLVLTQVAGGFRFTTNPNNASWVQRMLAGRPARLSRSQLECLAVIAYRQPITKAEIDHVRGVDCSAVLRILLDRDLAKIVGRKEEPGRPHLYGTSIRFLEFFNLRNLRDLPDLREFRELNEESQATLRSQLGDEVADEVEVMGQEVIAFEESASAVAEESADQEGAGDETRDETGASTTEDVVEAPVDAESEAEGETDPDDGPDDGPEIVDYRAGDPDDASGDDA